jgi:DNA-binding NarL/FixJ family response regulator
MTRRVLVVDNRASFRRLALLALNSWGHVVVGEASTAAEAMRHAAELRPDTVLVDIGLPDGDGFSLTTELVALPSPPRVILTSADDDAVYTVLALRAGALGFVPKQELSGAKLRNLIESDEHGRRAASFGAEAAAYARGRPGYPPAALRFCLPEAARRVLDLGAGTGKLTGGLLALGLEVIAVEPSPEMGALIDPSADVRAGTAEAIPLEDAAVDAVLVGQAFHWFAREAALAEIVRVLRPGGTVGLLWNRVRGGEAWIQEIARAMREASHSVEVDAPWMDRDDLTDPEWRTFTHWQETDAEGLLDNVRSRSVVILTEPDERERVLERVRALAPPGRFRLPLECGVWRATRVDPHHEAA